MLAGPLPVKFLQENWVPKRNFAVAERRPPGSSMKKILVRAHIKHSERCRALPFFVRSSGQANRLVWSYALCAGDSSFVSSYRVKAYG